MSQPTDMREIQRRTYRLVQFEDGLWDLMLGTIFLFLAIYPISRELLGPAVNMGFFLGLLALLVALNLMLRNRLSVPRIGYAVPKRPASMRAVKVLAILMVLITLGLVLITAFGPADSSVTAPAVPANPRGYLVEWIVMLAMGALFSAMGFFFGVSRLYFYGWMLGLANLAAVYMSHTAGWKFSMPLAAAAGVILILGAVRLEKFMRTYPLRATSS